MSEAKTADPMAPVECSCPDWKRQLYILESIVDMAGARAGKDIFKDLGGKRFDWCPWCGLKLEEI